MFYGNGVCVDRNLDSFIQDANVGFAQVRTAECLIREKQRDNPMTEVQHLLDAFAKQAEIRQFRREIEAHHLDALEASKLPCEITKAIRSKVLAFSWMPLFISLALIPLNYFLGYRAGLWRTEVSHCYLCSRCQCVCCSNGHPVLLSQSGHANAEIREGFSSRHDRPTRNRLGILGPKEVPDDR